MDAESEVAGELARRSGALRARLLIPGVLLSRLETSPGSFWDIEYDYGEDGQVTAELWPGSRQTDHTYDAQGRLIRTILPVPTGDMIRYDYDEDDDDGRDPSELRQIAHERTVDEDYLLWGRDLDHDALGRLVRAHLVDRGDGTDPSIELAYNTDGTVDTWQVRRRSSTSDINVVNRGYAYRADGMLAGWSSNGAGGRRAHVLLGRRQPAHLRREELRSGLVSDRLDAAREPHLRPPREPRRDGESSGHDHLRQPLF